MSDERSILQKEFERLGERFPDFSFAIVWNESGFEFDESGYSKSTDEPIDWNEVWSLALHHPGGILWRWHHDWLFIGETVVRGCYFVWDKPLTKTLQEIQESWQQGKPPLSGFIRIGSNLAKDVLGELKPQRSPSWQQVLAEDRELNAFYIEAKEHFSRMAELACETVGLSLASGRKWKRVYPEDTWIEHLFEAFDSEPDAIAVKGWRARKLPCGLFKCSAMALAKIATVPLRRTPVRPKKSTSMDDARDRIIAGLSTLCLSIAQTLNGG